jgi:ABC-type transport system involved in cytochrome bd biosynthesis fused ATPase/permease subunit
LFHFQKLIDFSGKSSLLNLLAGRALNSSTHRITGEITVNGTPIDPAKYK